MAKYRLRQPRDPSLEQNSEQGSISPYEVPQQMPVTPETPQTRARYRLRPKQQVDTSSVSANAKEFATHGLKGVAKGALGTYGDILDLAGLQAKATLPGEQLQYEQEHDILQKLLQGETPSLGELETLSPQDVAPRYSKLPSSADVGTFLESLGAPGQPETGGGRYGSRIGQFLGAGVSFGAPAPVASSLAGAVGQTAEEVGVPPWGQAALEIATFIKTGKPGKPKITSKSPEIEQELNRLRELGFSEQDLTLAKNALRETGVLEKVSKATKGSKEKINSSLKALQEKHGEILNKAFPGLEGGVEAVERNASELYQAMDELAAHTNIPRGNKFIRAVYDVKERLGRSLANTPEEKQIMEFLDTAAEAARKPTPADFYTRFYRGLNGIGRWTNPSEREKIFGEIKNSIKETFREAGTDGKALANEFEKANEGWRQLRQAEDLSKLFGRAITDEGVNYKKLSTIFDNPSNFEDIVKGVGKEQANNLKLIAKTGENLSNLQKSIEGGTVKKVFGAGKLYGLAKGILTFNPSLLKDVIGVELAGRFATKLLTDPNFQRLHIRALKKANANKWGAVKSIVTQMQKELEHEPSHTKNTEQ